MNIALQHFDGNFRAASLARQGFVESNITEEGLGDGRRMVRA
jgi:hypothetical protein